MAGAYTETPDNFSEIEPFVELEISAIRHLFYASDRIVFYDTCSWQRHAQLGKKERNLLIGYLKTHGAVIFLTRCVLMELAADRHRLIKSYVEFFSALSDGGVKIALFNEEHTYDILAECFSTSQVINQYLVWAVRSLKSPAGTIRETLRQDAGLAAEVITGKHANRTDLYRRFFSAVRKNKEHGDNLGEELIALCLHMLSYLPGMPDGKLCVITDDKGAAGKINSLMNGTNMHIRGAKPLLLSSPKLVQHMFQEDSDMSEAEMINMISAGVNGNIVVMGMTAYDFEVDVKISLSASELVQKIRQPGGITIVF